MRTILIQPDVKGAHKFRDDLAGNLTEFHFALSIEDVDVFDIEIVILWLSVPDFLSRLPNLKLLLTCGSGVDHIINSPDLPHNIPLIRLVDPFLQNHVSEYVVEQISKHFFPEKNYEKGKETVYSFFETSQQKKPKIGIMGLGLVGLPTALKLSNMGFEVCGWVRLSKNRLIKDVYVGNAELEDFAKKSDVIVCQLPLTQETKGILNIKLFRHLPDGAYLINVGRGAHLIQSDLLLGLEMGKISGACLDVFEVEPLPSDHPFITNPKIKITPHIAGYIGPETQAPYASQIIASYYKNEKTKGEVDYLSLY